MSDSHLGIYRIYIYTIIIRNKPFLSLSLYLFVFIFLHHFGFCFPIGFKMHILMSESMECINGLMSMRREKIYIVLDGCRHINRPLRLTPAHTNTQYSWLIFYYWAVNRVSLLSLIINKIMTIYFFFVLIGLFIDSVLILDFFPWIIILKWDAYAGWVKTQKWHIQSKWRNSFIISIHFVLVKKETENRNLLPLNVISHALDRSSGPCQALGYMRRKYGLSKT